MISDGECWHPAQSRFRLIDGWSTTARKKAAGMNGPLCCEECGKQTAIPTGDTDNDLTPDSAWVSLWYYRRGVLCGHCVKHGSRFPP